MSKKTNQKVLTKWRVNPDKTHPWIVECETYIPGVYGEVAKVGYRPHAYITAASPQLLEAAEAALAWMKDAAVTRLSLPASIRDKLQAAIKQAEGSDG